MASISAKYYSQIKKTRYAWARYFNICNELHATQHHLIDTFGEEEKLKSDLKNCPEYLQKFIIELYNDSKKGIECPICLEVVNPEDLQTRICGHNFHKACNEKCIEEKSECPICRK